MYKKIVSAATLFLTTLSAFAQSGAPVKQSGNITPNTVPWWITSGVIGSGVTAVDSPISSFGATGPICSLSARQVSGAWNSLCLQANASSAATISLQNYGTAPAQPLNFVINGTTYQFPFTSAGVVGPATTVVGDVAYWNNTVGTLLGRIPDVLAGQPFVSGGVGVLPTYSGPWLYFDTGNKFQRITKNTTGWTPTNLNTLLHLVGANSGVEVSVEMQAFNTDAVYNGIRANGTASAPTALLANDQIATMASGGYDGSAIAQGPTYGIFASENWTPTHNGSDHRWFLIQAGSTNFTQSMTLRNYNLGVGTETNPKYRITAGKNATAGITSPFGNDGFGAIGADSGGAIAYEALAFANTPLVNLYRANGTNASKTALTSGQQLGGFFGDGWDGSSWQVGAGMYAVANQNWSAGVAGSRLDFYANANGGTSNTLAASIFGGGTFSVFPTSGTTNKGISIAQTLPSSGTPVGPILGNTIDVTNPGLGASGSGHDNFGGQSLIYGIRATMSITGTSSGSGSAAFGAFTNIAAASDGFGASSGVTITGASPAGHNAWGHIAYGVMFTGGQVGLLVGLDAEMGISAGAAASFRVGVSSNSQGPVQGSTLDAAFAANTINMAAAYGGNAAPWQHLMALSGSMYSGIGFPLATTGDFFFSDTAGTVAHFANLSNVTVTGNILIFPNMTLAGNGGALFGPGSAPSAGQLITACVNCGKSVTAVTPDGTAGAAGVTLIDSSGNNFIFAGVAEASNTVTRFGQTAGNFANVTSNGSTNLGMLLGTVTNVPLIVGTNNTERMRVTGIGGLNLGSTLAVLTATEFGMNKISASGSAPGAGTAKLAIVAGTNAGTCKLIMYAGTSTTPSTVLDNVGAGC